MSFSYISLRLRNCRFRPLEKLSAMIRYFARNRFISRTITPRWNLTSVLWSLCSAPYEPLGQASLLNLSIKTAYLLAFATAKRRGQLHALSCAQGHISFAQDSVTSYWNRASWQRLRHYLRLLIRSLCLPFLETFGPLSPIGTYVLSGLLKYT